MSVTQKPLPGADSKHFLAISYPLDWEKTLKIFVFGDDNVLMLSGIVPYGFIGCEKQGGFLNMNNDD
jgi:hypothetical protein